MSSGPQWSHWSERFRGERPSADQHQLELWGYSGLPSYAPGEEVALHVSTTAATFDVLIYRDGAEAAPVFRADEVSGAWHETPEDAYATGCGWPVALTIAVPDEWRSGGYVVELAAEDSRGLVRHEAFFVVRPTNPGASNPFALVVATYTWQAYNDWGGASAYSRNPELRPAVSGENEDDLAAAQRTAAGFSPRLSFDRPWARGLIRLPLGAPRVAHKDPPPIGWAPRIEQAEWAFANGFSIWSGMAGWARHDTLFARWAEAQGYEFDVLSQWDIDRDPRCLDNYECVVTVGHDEYWTASGRAALDGFIERGGRYARLAGNIFWQIRLEDAAKTFVCHKYLPETDPLFSDEDRSMRTGAFESQHIANPPATTFGANGARGVYSRMGAASPRGVGGFVVYRNKHWAFAGTDLYYADVLGADIPLVGYEADGLSYTFKDGLPVATREDGAPDEVAILALTPVAAEEEDHQIPGGFLLVGDGDLSFVAHALLGADTPENREKVRRGAAVMTHMHKGAGEVFCGGSTEWPYALSLHEPMVEQVVRNVLDRYGRR